MAFNLNKGDEPAPKKTSFDLSKTEPATGTNERKKKPVWLFAFVGIAVIALGAWYLTRHERTLNDSKVFAASAVGNNDTAAKVSDTVVHKPIAANEPVKNAARPKQKDIQPGEQPVEAKAKVGPATSVQNTPVIAASFMAGSARPKISVATVAEIRKQVSAKKGAKIKVLGYASSEGPLIVNKTISQARADAYKQFLVNKGIAGALITAQGKGIENPIASNDTEEGRKKNRRVEVSFQ